MNELSSLFINIKSGDTIELEANRVYHVKQDNSFVLHGYYCSNSAKKHENPDGTRYSAIYLVNKQNITIDGNGATILVHGKMTPMLFDKCENVTVKNLCIDYARPTMSEFTVTSCNNGVYTLSVSPESRFTIKRNDILWLGEDDLNGKPYWKDSFSGKGRYFKIYNPETELSTDFSRDDFALKKAQLIDEHTVKCTLKNKNVHLPVGHVVQTRTIVRDQVGSMFQRCKNLVFESLRVKFMHGLGMVSQFCENVSFINCNMTPAENRTIASTADFFQFSGCRGKILVDGCTARGAHDDYVNIHGTHLCITKKSAKENSITVSFRHPETWGFQAFEVGDEIEFIRWDTLIPYFCAKVERYTRLNNKDIKLFLDSPLPDEIVTGKDSVENATWTPEVHITNCSFGATCGRGILCTTRRNVLIENNTFSKLWGPALLIEDDCNFWFESGYTKNVIFRNNRVAYCDYAQMWKGCPSVRCTPKVMNESSAQFVHSRLCIDGNTFEQAHGDTHLFHLEYVERVEVKNNMFDAPYRINTRCVGHVEEDGNTVKK